MKKTLLFTTSLIVGLLFVLPVSAQDFPDMLPDMPVNDGPSKNQIRQVLDIRNIFADYYTWSQSGANGLGVATNLRFTTYEFNGYLYAYAYNLVNDAGIYRTNDGVVWESIDPGWTTDPNNGYIYRMYEFNDYLYAGTYNTVGGTEIWRTQDGTTWTQVNTDGFGNNNNIAVLFYSANDYLYAYAANVVNGGQIWRTQDGTTWTQSTVPINAGDRWFYDLEEYNGYLYTSSYNPGGAHMFRSADGATWSEVADGTFTSCVYADLEIFKGSLYALENQSVGFTADGNRIWSSTNGTGWTQEDDDGFGDADNNGNSTLLNYNGLFLAANNNLADGAKVYYSEDGGRWYLTGSDDGSAGMGDDNNTYFYIYHLGNAVYLTSHNTTTGTEVWRSPGGTYYKKFSNADGFGDADNTYSYASKLDSNIYISTYNNNTGSEIWKTQDTPEAVSDFTGKRKVGKIKFTWSTPAGNEISHYNVRCRTEALTEDNWDNAGFVEKNKQRTVGAASESLTLKNLTPGQKYWCGVKSVNSINGMSDMSNTISRIVKLGKVRNLEVYNIKSDRATVDWNAPANARGMVKKYILQLRTKKGKKINTFKKIKKTKKVIKSKYLEPGKSYKIKVRTVDNYAKKYKFTKYKKFKTKTNI